MNALETLILTTAVAGVAGTGLGGILGTRIRKDSNDAASLLLSFAGGIMLSVVSFDLIPEALETGAGMFLVLASLLLGVAIIFALNRIVHQKTDLHPAHSHGSHPKKPCDDKQHAPLVTGIIMASAIAIHNIPEGMTLGASYAGRGGVMGSAALTLAILIGIHNIPLGMAISVPFIRGGLKPAVAAVITAAIGSLTVFGALFGYLLGDISTTGLAVSLGFASGAMLYVIFDELLPQAILLYHSKLPTFFTILGMVLGIVILSL